MRFRVCHIVRGLLIAALAGVTWSAAMETIEFDGFVVTFDPNQAFLVVEGDLDCSRYGGESAVRVTETSGRAGDADYLFYLPAEWNGDLVLHVHPPYPPAGEFAFPLPLGFDDGAAEGVGLVERDIALCHGFAWAASAMARYGAAYEDGIRDTHLLQSVVRRHHLPADPGAVFVTGVSFGGLVAVALVETYPERYAGALADRAGLGGLIMALSHIVQTRETFDLFFPGLIEPYRPGERSMAMPAFMAFREALLTRLEAEPDVLRRMASVRLLMSDQWDPDGVGIPLLFENPRAPTPMAAHFSLVNSLMVRLSSSLLGPDDRVQRPTVGHPRLRVHRVRLERRGGGRPQRGHRALRAGRLRHRLLDGPLRADRPPRGPRRGDVRLARPDRHHRPRLVVPAGRRRGRRERPLRCLGDRPLRSRHAHAAGVRHRLPGPRRLGPDG